ncbi:MAG: hypothetical protein KF830_06595 [Planctomycetes bacterium]|nr:hypothetical protein [Planctomycetota bacterium]
MRSGVVKARPGTGAIGLGLAGVMLLGIWGLTRASDNAMPPTESRHTQADAAASPASRVAPVAESERAPLVREAAAPTQERPAELPTLAQGGETDGFPPEYRGVRDRNVLSLYKSFLKSLAFEEERMRSFTDADLETGVHCTYLETKAYLQIIQNHSFHYYGYAPAPQRPANTEDAEYHLTGLGGMQVVFALTRQEFPDLFAAKDKRRQYRDQRR